MFGEATAVSNVSFTFDSGEMVGIIGPSGAGKSTLLRMVNRLVEPTSGKILFNGHNICKFNASAIRKWRAKCAMIFQQFNLVGRMDVITNVLVGRLGYRSTLPTLFKKFPVQDKEMAIRALDRLGMAKLALKRVDTLSGGQQQRVAIAKALVQSPVIMLADDPIASLDPGNAGIVMEALSSINQEFNITVLCNLHHLDIAKEFCPRIIGMRDGVNVFDGPPEALTNQQVMDIYGLEGREDSLSIDPPSPCEPQVRVA